MRTRKLLNLGLLSTLILASCTNNDDFSEWGKENGQIKFTSYIEGMKTKAVDASWTEGDQIGIFMKTASTELASAFAVNKKYITNANGVLSAATANDALYYPSDGNAVDFIAYYPYTTSLDGTTYKVDVTSQENQPAIDLLYSDNAKNMKEGNPTLAFSHKLSKVVMNIETDATIASLNGLQIKISGMNTKADFNLADGTLGAASNKADINVPVNEANKKAEAIVLPATLEGVKVVFVLNGISKEADLTGTYEAGKKYTYTVKLSHSGETPVIQFGNATISDWTEVPGGNIDVDFGNGSVVEPGEAVVVTKDKPYNALVDGQGDFTINDVQIPDGGTYVWKWDVYEKDGQVIDQYMKASAYIGSPKASESWLISPALDLSQLTKAVLTFEHTHKFAGTPSEELTLWISEAEQENWQQLTIDKYGSNNDYNFVTPSIDLTSYVGKTVKIAFKYVSTTSAAGTWEVKNFKVAEGEGGGTVDPEPEDGVVFTETLGYATGGAEANKVKIASYTGWDNASFTFADSYGAADVRGIAYKTPENTSETQKVNNVWFPAGKDSELSISGFSTEGYKTLTLTYQAAANVFNAGTSIDLNALEIYFNGNKVSVPSQVVSKDNNDANIFYTMTVTLDASAVSAESTLRFFAPASTNNVGLRLTNIKLSGTK